MALTVERRDEAAAGVVERVVQVHFAGGCTGGTDDVGAGGKATDRTDDLQGGR